MIAIIRYRECSLLHALASAGWCAKLLQRSNPLFQGNIMNMKKLALPAIAIVAALSLAACNDKDADPQTSAQSSSQPAPAASSETEHSSDSGMDNSAAPASSDNGSDSMGNSNP
ncbi:hypothetical protein [Celerinatantimonas sp. YJH-8]|uniref:hypothetical protein n=1 Tax=Celerinatantimonas sp. YJH-8 TaxID=3228714 RepID=UPI0038C7B682